ncbi:hypothetical protein CLU79DRAFT_749960 [Phycomyces nitens]|nr:hypothetical protein CLU79DRAFT_749960 [Phycomyces nitens]
MTLDNSNISLVMLQSKLAFLLGIACSLGFYSIISGCLPKIMNEATPYYQTKAYIDQYIFPVNKLQILLQHWPTCQFFIAGKFDQFTYNSFIFIWISKLVYTRMRNECRQDLLFPLLLKYVIPKEDIVTMGNQTACKTFEGHHHRDHLSTFEFTNTLIKIRDTFEGDPIPMFSIMLRMTLWESIAFIWIFF